MKQFEVSYTLFGRSKVKRFNRDSEAEARDFAQHTASATGFPAFVYTMELTAISKFEPQASPSPSPTKGGVA